MKVRAKFRCNSVEDFGSSKSVKLSPVYPGENASDEDKAFWDSTPSGTLQMSVTRPPVGDFFKPNALYYLDFEAAE